MIKNIPLIQPNTYLHILYKELPYTLLGDEFTKQIGLLSHNEQVAGVTQKCTTEEENG